VTAPPGEGGANILVVDDEDSIRDALARFLVKRGYRVRTARTGEQALQEIKDGGAALLLLDVRMPGMSGVDVVPEALHLDPDLAIVMLSGATDATSAAICMQRGALDYLTKPIELAELAGAIERALRRRDTLLQERHITRWIQEELEHRARELERGRRKLEQLSIATLEALINALEAKDRYLSGHSARVAAFAATVAQQLGMPDEEIEQVRVAGRLHDLGKIGVRESVLNKEGPLTREEYEHVKEHVLIGSQILAPLTHLGPIVAFVRGHHEHFDGSGYPDRLRGEDIPLGARILSAAEIYDALTTARPYQPLLTPEQAVERMRRLAGSVVDPRVLDAIAAAVAKRQTLVFLDEDPGAGA